MNTTQTQQIQQLLNNTFYCVETVSTHLQAQNEILNTAINQTQQIQHNLNKASTILNKMRFSSKSLSPTTTSTSASTSSIS